MQAPPSARPWARSPEALILACLAVSRLLYFAAGVRFQTHLIAFNLQFIDLELLKTRLWESLYYYHMQPPLMNLIAGTFLKLAPEHYGALFHIFYFLLGACSSLLLFRTMRLLGVGERIALVLTVLFAVSPGCVLFENFPMYEYIILFLLLLAGTALYRLMQSPSLYLSFVFFSVLALLSYIRSLYHLYVILFAVVVVCALVPRDRLRVLAGAAVPVLAVLALFVKNLIVFGFFGSSSWLGSNLVVVTAHQLTPADKLALIQAGRISKLALVEPPSPVEAYAPFVDIGETGIPVLDQKIKTGGSINTNNLVFLKIDKQYRELSKQVLGARPKAYLESIAIAWFAYFLPPTDFFQFDENRSPIRWLDRAVNLVVYGQFLETSRKGLRSLKAEGHGLQLPLYTGTFLIVMVPFLLGWGAWLAWKGFRTGSLTRPQLALLLFQLFNIVFIMLTTTLLSSFENNRYRYPSEPLFIALLGTAIQAWRQKGLVIHEPV